MGRLADLILGKYRYCREVRVDGKSIGYLCENLEMVTNLILGSELDPHADIHVHQVYRRYKPPRKPLTNPFNAKGERKRIPKANTQPQAKRRRPRRRNKKVWRWGKGRFHKRHS